MVSNSLKRSGLKTSVVSQRAWSQNVRGHCVRSKNEHGLKTCIKVCAAYRLCAISTVCTGCQI